MLDELGWAPPSQRRHKARLILFYTIINGLAEGSFECVLIEAYTAHEINTIRNKTDWSFNNPPPPVWSVIFPQKTISAWNGLTFVEALSLAEFNLNYRVSL